MKWLRTLILFDQGDVAASADWRDLHESYVRSIQSIEHPLGSGRMIMRRKVKSPTGKWTRNGVGHLRKSFLEHIRDIEGWEPEGLVDLGRDRQQPPIRSRGP